MGILATIYSLFLSSFHFNFLLKPRAETLLLHICYSRECFFGFTRICIGKKVFRCQLPKLNRRWHSHNLVTTSVSEVATLSKGGDGVRDQGSQPHFLEKLSIICPQLSPCPSDPSCWPTPSIFVLLPTACKGYFQSSRLECFALPWWGPNGGACSLPQPPTTPIQPTTPPPTTTLLPSHPDYPSIPN